MSFVEGQAVVTDESDEAADFADEELGDIVLDALFSQSPVGLHVYDRELRLVRVNTAARLIREFPIDQMLGRPLDEILDAFDIPDRAAVERTAHQVLESGAPVLDLPIRIRGRQEPRFEVVASAAVFRLQRGDGTVLGIASALTDVTARVRAEAGLRLLNEAATHVGTTLDVFRTADEFCEITCPAMADSVTLDIFDTVLRGQALSPDALNHATTLRRAGFRSVDDSHQQGVPVVGEVDSYPPGTPYWTALDALAPKLIRKLRPDAAWLDPTRWRDARILDAGAHSLMAVPIRARGVLLGLVCFYRWRNPSPFDHRDLKLAEQLSAHVGQCLDNARLYGRERSVARLMSAGLARTPAPVAAAMDLAHTYLPTGTGGGWFDTIPLSGARVALVAGDTASGTADPAAMGGLRAAIEALSGLDLPPDEILERLHDLASRPDPTSDGPRATDIGRAGPATCLYLVYDPVSRLCTAASAGHPAPVLLLPGGQAETLDVTAGPALGQGLAHFRLTERALPENSTLLIYGRSLVAPSAVRTLPERLKDALSSHQDSLQSACDALAQTLGPDRPHRDTYLLLAGTRTLGADRTNAWTFPNSPEIVSAARKRSTAQLTDWGMDPDVADNTALIVSELVTNAVRYAKGPIQLRLILSDTLVCEVSDDSNTAPHLRRALDTDEHGRGLFITAQLTQRWGVRPSRRGKTLWAEQALP